MEIQIHNFPEQLPGTEQSWTELTQSILKAVQLAPESLGIIFVDDQTLKQMHEQYLNDPELTDVMTFDMGDEGRIEGEIYISVDRAVDQAKAFNNSFAEEMLRLIIHGILHLKGYDDLQPEAQAEMKKEEDRLVEQFRTVVESF